ncbi:MAG: sugar transferase [Maritimibacter sp.]
MFDHTGHTAAFPVHRELGEVAQTLALPQPHSRFYRHYGKRAFDIGFVLIILPFLLPLIAGLAALIRLDGGPAFHIQTRIGQTGRRFRCLKLRSMVVDGEDILTTYLEQHPEERQHWFRNCKLDHDPRVTRIGQILRRASLDELPQFFNVLRGDMSVVGPRPFLPDEEERYRVAGGGAYYAMRPGITGSWQVSSRHRSSFESRILFDDSYDLKLSLHEDLRLILATISVVLRGTGR